MDARETTAWVPYVSSSRVQNLVTSALLCMRKQKKEWKDRLNKYKPSVQAQYRYKHESLHLFVPSLRFFLLSHTEFLTSTLAKDTFSALLQLAWFHTVHFHATGEEKSYLEWMLLLGSLRIRTGHSLAKWAQVLKCTPAIFRCTCCLSLCRSYSLHAMFFEGIVWFRFALHFSTFIVASSENQHDKTCSTCIK